MKSFRCERCSSGESFSSRNKLFAHLKVCSVNRNPSDAIIASDEEFFAANDAVNVFLCTAGGRIRGKTLQNAEIYDFCNDSWSPIPNIADNRGSHASSAVGQYFYVLGGGGLDSNLTSVERFDIVSGVWQKMAPMPSARHALNAVAIDHRIFVVGGWVYGTVCCPALEIYDTLTDTWSTGPDLPTPRRLMGVASSSGRIFCFGGSIGKEDQWTSDALDIYDSSTSTWTVGKRLPIAGQCSAASCGDFIYVACHGNFIYRYCPRTDEYIQISFALPLPQWFGFDMCAFNHRLYILGGATAGRWSKELWRYDILENRWRKCAEMRQERRRCSCAVIVAPKDMVKRDEVEASVEAAENNHRKRKVEAESDLPAEQDNSS